jgi:hypothetical protein
LSDDAERAEEAAANAGKNENDNEDCNRYSNKCSDARKKEHLISSNAKKFKKFVNNCILYFEIIFANVTYLLSIHSSVPLVQHTFALSQHSSS